jgi:integrase
MRPGELASATAADLDVKAGTLTVRNKTKRQTGVRLRVVYLPPQAAKILAKAAKQHPTGALLWTARGAPWRESARGKAFDRVRDALGVRATLYTYRVGFVSDALAAGVSPAIVAELAGHSTLIMMKHYARLSDRGDVLRAAAASVRPGAMSARRRSPRRH